ncbi:hypothetical protein OIU78_015468, partial [Salix suchowensis]
MRWTAFIPFTSLAFLLCVVWGGTSHWPVKRWTPSGL